MSFSGTQTPREHGGLDHRNAAIQVICLGSGGGPSEDNVSGFLVRSAASGWIRGSLLAVDAGSHLSSITRILEKHLPLVTAERARLGTNAAFTQQAQSPMAMPVDDISPPSSPIALPPPRLEPTVLHSGPFAGVPLPHASARANAAHIVRSHVATYLISHPHLDHISGFAINTAAFHATTRPKTLAALPFTVESIKKHIFNDVIWPNLTDEDGGVGFVTFQRLKEGGDIMVGEGEGRGYIEVCEGLGTKGFKISHGKCMHSGTAESQRGSVGAATEMPTGYSTTPKYTGDGVGGRNRSMSILHNPGTPSSYASPILPNTSTPFQQDHNAMAVDSTAYFIRDIATAREILMFGDVEPDSLSVAPRLARVWAEAAPKIAAGILTGIFIECSYADSQADAVLFGHLAPRHLIAELQVLGEMVREERQFRATEKAMRKRKRMGKSGSVGWEGDVDLDRKRSRSVASRNVLDEFRRSSMPEPHSAGRLSPAPTSARLDHTGMVGSPLGPSHGTSRSDMVNLSLEEGITSEVPTRLGPPVPPKGTAGMIALDPPFRGLRVIVMHIKDTMEDGPHVSELILEQLNAHALLSAERGSPLGCVFECAESGQDYWF